MERTAWSDERIADTLEAIRHGSGRHDEEIRELRSETRAEFGQLRAESSQFRAETRAEFADVRAEMRTEFADVRKEMRQGFTEVRGEMAALRITIVRFGGGLMVGLMVAFVSVIATILLRTPA